MDHRFAMVPAQARRRAKPHRSIRVSMHRTYLIAGQTISRGHATNRLALPSEHTIAPGCYPGDAFRIRRQRRHAGVTVCFLAGNNDKDSPVALSPTVLGTR